MTEESALLVLACSRRKSRSVLRGRSWDIYDGPTFQVLKKLLNEHPSWQSGLSIVIVSARYGILTPDDEIETYDEWLTAESASRLADVWAPRLRAILTGRQFTAAHANLGRHYRAALPELTDLLAPTPIDWAVGGIGTRNSLMKRWVARHLAGTRDEVSFETERRRLPRRSPRSDSRS